MWVNSTTRIPVSGRRALAREDRGLSVFRLAVGFFLVLFLAMQEPLRFVALV
jgi:hypothetical protein